MDTPDKIIKQISKKASGDNEVLQAFQKLLEDNVKLPADGFVIGEPVSVSKIEYSGNARLGLTAKCSRGDGSVHMIALADVVFPKTLKGEQYISAFRKWIGLTPLPDEGQTTSLSEPHHKATADDIDLTQPVELIVLSAKERTARCRLMNTNRIITLRASDLWDIAPGEIVTIQPGKLWKYGGHPYISGEIQSSRLDVQALNLVPLGLEDMGIWDPKEHYWGDENEPIEEWAIPIIAAGPRPMFEMKQIRFEEDDSDPFNDPFCRAVDFKNDGQMAEARKILMELCQADLRCLDVHSHLGSFAFDYYPQNAIRYYEVGLRIGELSLGVDFTGVLLWGFIDNRPFLRCMHGYGSCLWRLGRFKEAEQIFNRMLWLNPADNQGVGFIIDEVKAKMTWEDYEKREA